MKCFTPPAPPATAPSFVLALWAILQGAGRTDMLSGVLFTAATVIGIYGGIANALAVAAQLRHWVHELNRERTEVHDNPVEEREELRAIYEAKGFSGQQLESIVDTLCSDEDRLLRVMMEEEMGIFFEQWNHPAIIGAIAGAASVAGGLAVAAAAVTASTWLPVAAAAAILALAAMIRTGWARPATVESFVRWCLVAGAVCGIAFFLSRWITGGAMTTSSIPFSLRRSVNPILSDRPLDEEEGDATRAFLMPAARQVEHYLPLVSAMLAGAFLLVAYLSEKLSGPAGLTHICTLVAFLLGGMPGLSSAWESLRERRIDIDVLMVLGAGLAAVIGQPMEGRRFCCSCSPSRERSKRKPPAAPNRPSARCAI